MTNNFYSAEQVAAILMVSKPTAYRIIKKLNDELFGRGYITINGKVSIKFFHEKFYGTRGQSERSD